ncbi:hypothetical protein Tco_1495474, partial [Tanacetum coccineum]
RDDDIFISQDKYVDDILKKFDFSSVKTASTLIETNKALLKDEEAEDVDVHLYRSMIGSLIYLKVIMLELALTGNQQHDVVNFLAKEVGEGSGQPTDPQHTSTSAQFYNEEPITVLSLSQLKKTHKPRKAKRTTMKSQSSGTIHLVADKTVYKEWEDRMERAATTASSLEAEQDSGSGLRYQVTILGGAEAQTRFEAASKQSNDPHGIDGTLYNGLLTSIYFLFMGCT